jgi:hypothetical protein
MYKKYYIHSQKINIVRFSIFVATILPLSFVMMLFLGTSHLSNSVAQQTNNTANSVSLLVAGNGSHGADLFVDPKTNQIYITYIKTQNDSSDLFFTKTIDENYTLSKPVRINDKVGDVMWDGRVPPQIEVTDNGTIYTLWVSSKEAPGFMYGFRTLKMAQSLDGGETFTPAVNVTNKDDPTQAKAFQTFDIGNNGNIYVGSLNYDAQILDNGTIISTDEENGTLASIAVSTDGGSTFNPTLNIDKFACECCNVNVLAASTGDVYASWRDKFPVAPNTDPQVDPVIRDMVVSHSADGGITFDTPNKIANDSFVFGGCVHVGAPMVEDSKGNIHVVWYTGAEDHPGIYYAYTSDKARSFSKPVPVLTGDWIPPLRSDISVDEKDNIWITWEDSYGLTALDENWKFENTSAIIHLGKIENNTLVKYPPVNTENGREPSIGTGNGLVAVLWNGDNSINMSVLRPNELTS